MHDSSYENMKLCCDEHLTPAWTSEQGIKGGQGGLAVLEVGSAVANETPLSYRDLFTFMPGVIYTGMDLVAGPGVDVVMPDPYVIPGRAGALADSFYDLVLCGQTFEHCSQFWRLFAEMIRVLRPGGLLFLIAPSAGPVHRYPVDCYRFNPDAFESFVDLAPAKILACWSDTREPWRDLVGVYRKDR